MTDDERMDRTSRPDPTTLTTDALERAVAGLKELLGQSVTHESNLRIKDIEALQRELLLLDRQRVEGKAADTASLAAALSAAKEAVRENNLSFEKAISKTETATNDQIKSIVTTFQTALDSVNNTISDAKDRINKLEQVQAAQGGQQEGASATVAWILAAVGGIVAVASIIIQLSH